MKPLEGHVKLEGEDLAPFKAHEIVYKGIAMVPEGRRIFARLNVAENLEMGAYSRNSKQEIASDLERVYSLFPRLRERRAQIAGTLSGGEQQMLATGRALMARPRILLMDEPSMGLAPVLVRTPTKRGDGRVGNTSPHTRRGCGRACLVRESHQDA